MSLYINLWKLQFTQCVERLIILDAIYTKKRIAEKSSSLVNEGGF